MTGAGQTREEIARYRRQLSLAGFGRQGQERLGQAHAVVIGAGGLGSPALLYLAAAGIGRLTIIDDDEVALANLHRQIIHTTAGVGTAKVDSARAALQALNPLVDVVTARERLTAANAPALLGDASVVLDGSDNFATRYVASWACATAGVPHVWASILGFDAQLSVFWAGHGPIYEDLFPTPPAPGSVPSCSQAGVLGPVVGVVGAAMALEAIKLVTGVGEPLTGRLGYFSALGGTWEYIPLAADPAVARRIIAEGPVRGAQAFEEPLLGATRPSAPETPAVAEVATIPPGALVIDVRDPDEVAQFAMPESVKFPLARILAGETPPGLEQALSDARPVVLHCAGGARSARAVAALAARDIEGVYSLRGGIDAWLDASD